MSINLNINGHELNWTREYANEKCHCGHVRLQHVHLNGGWCGTPTTNGKYCECNGFVLAGKTVDEISTEAVNFLATLDMKYTFTSEEHDGMLKLIQMLHQSATTKQ